MMGASLGQAPDSCWGFSWQPVHFSGGASLHCLQHHLPAYTTSVNGNGRHRATSPSASTITTPTNKMKIHFITSLLMRDNRREAALGIA
jgi:hypothetical protein